MPVGETRVAFAMKVTDRELDRVIRELGIAAQSTESGVDTEMGQFPFSGPGRDDMREVLRMWLRGDL